MTYKVTHNGADVEGKTTYTRRGLLFESGKETYEDGCLIVESNFTNRPTNLFCVIIYLLLIISLVFIS